MKTLSTSIVCAVLLTASAQGQLVLFDFAGGSLEPSILELNLQSSSMGTGSSFNQFTSAAGWDSAAQISGAGGFFSNPGTQASAGNALFFELVAAPGYHFSIHGVRYDARSTSTAPADIGFTLNGLRFDQSALFTNDSTITTVSQTGLGFEEITLARFSIQAWNATGSGALQLDNVGLWGTVTAIPEPSTYAVLLGFMGLLLVYRQRCVRMKRQKGKAIAGSVRAAGDGIKTVPEQPVCD